MSWSDATPLAGAKILDLCHVVSGPFATMQLGDLGADVVKIEEPGRGDESRSYGPPFLGGESAYFLSVNRSNRSCVIDLKSEAGKDLILRLASVADVIVESAVAKIMRRPKSCPIRTGGRENRSTGHVQDGIGLFRVFLQCPDRLRRGKQEQSDVPALGFLPHFFHDRQGAGTGADDQLAAFPRYLLFDR